MSKTHLSRFRNRSLSWSFCKTLFVYSSDQGSVFVYSTLELPVLEFFNEFVGGLSCHRCCLHLGDHIAFFISGGKGSFESILKLFPGSKCGIFCIVLFPLWLFPHLSYSILHKGECEDDLLSICVIDPVVHHLIHFYFQQEVVEFLSFFTKGSQGVYLDLFWVLSWDCHCGNAEGDGSFGWSGDWSDVL